MRECNVCKKPRKDSKFKNEDKLTCSKCEDRPYRKFLRLLVKERQLTPHERLGNRLGYMGSGLLMMSPYLLPYDNIGAYTYIMGAILCTPQVWLAKQWNLVVININLLIGYGIYIFG
tara:strand:+ start:49 stop:399 length:351 start_codon:yes stop_codon:yes gene_type:complete